MSFFQAQSRLSSPCSSSPASWHSWRHGFESQDRHHFFFRFKKASISYFYSIQTKISLPAKRNQRNHSGSNNSFNKKEIQPGQWFRWGLLVGISCLSIPINPCPLGGQVGRAVAWGWKGPRFASTSPTCFCILFKFSAAECHLGLILMLSRESKPLPRANLWERNRKWHLSVMPGGKISLLTSRNLDSVVVLCLEHWTVSGKVQGSCLCRYEVILFVSS